MKIQHIVLLTLSLSLFLGFKENEKKAIQLTTKIPSIVKATLDPKIPDCPISEIPHDALGTITASDFSVENLTAPLKQTNELPLLVQACQGTNKGWTDCVREKADGTKIPSSFNFSNEAKNDIVPQGERTYTFEYEDLARSDIHLYVVDAPNEYTSTATYNMYAFFPRHFIPSIKKVGDEFLVTLPTGELVTYDANTKKIKSGVLSEKPLVELPPIPGCNTQLKACGRKAKADPLTYSGKGVVIKVSASGDLPVGDGETTANKRIATILKGDKTCKIPAAELWHTDKKRGSNVVFDPKYSTDEAFDKVLKARCGFSMFD